MNQILQYIGQKNAILWICVISKKLIFLTRSLSQNQRAGHNETPLNLRFIHQSKPASLTSSSFGSFCGHPASIISSAGCVFNSWHATTSQTARHTRNEKLHALKRKLLIFWKLQPALHVSWHKDAPQTCNYEFRSLHWHWKRLCFLIIISSDTLAMADVSWI